MKTWIESDRVLGELLAQGWTLAPRDFPWRNGYYCCQDDTPGVPPTRLGTRLASPVGMPNVVARAHVRAAIRREPVANVSVGPSKTPATLGSRNEMRRRYYRVADITVQGRRPDMVAAQLPAPDPNGWGVKPGMAVRYGGRDSETKVYVESAEEYRRLVGLNFRPSDTGRRQPK